MRNEHDSCPQVRAWLPLLAVAWNQSVYYGCGQLARDLPHHDWTLPIDALVPFLPWTVSIYFLCYLFWAVNYVLAARMDKPAAYRFYLADFLAKGVCLVCFLVLPTTNARPEITGSGLWDNLMRFLYHVDAPVNLFPSIHCLVSWMCWIGVRHRTDIPQWYRYFSLCMALAVCLSTLTTRQHVIVDVIGGVALAELCWRVAGVCLSPRSSREDNRHSNR